MPIVVGSMAFPLNKEERVDDHHTHRWRVYVRGADMRDLSYVIRSVTFSLHPSFVDPVRDISSPPFEIAEFGWGEFEVGVKLFFHDDSIKPVSFKHMLKLYAPAGVELPKGTPVVSEVFDEVVFNVPSALSEEALTRLLAGPTKILPREGDDAYFAEHSPDADLAQLAGAHAFVRSETERLRERLARAEADSAQLAKDVVALGGNPLDEARHHVDAEAVSAAVAAAHAGLVG